MTDYQSIIDRCREVEAETPAAAIEALLAENARLRLLLQELCMDLENEIDGRYGQEIHPAMKRKYERDMDPCRRARRELGLA